MAFPDPPKKVETFTVEQRAYTRGQYKTCMIYVSLPPEANNRKFKITVEEIEENK